MDRNRTKTREQTLAELVAELGDLRRDAAGLGDDLVKALEEAWTSFHSALFPLLAAWARDWPVTSVHTYALAAGQLQLKTSLCVAPHSQAPQHFALADGGTALGGMLVPEGRGADLSAGLTLDDPITADGLKTLAQRALAGRELEMDFAAGWAVLPFAIMDGVVALLFVEFRLQQITPGDWLRLCASCEHLADQWRREVLAGRMTELRRLSSGWPVGGGGTAS